MEVDLKICDRVARVDERFLRDMLMIAHRSSLKIIKDICENRLQRCINKDNAFELLNLAMMYNCPQLKRDSVYFIRFNGLCTMSIYDKWINQKEIYELLEKTNNDINLFIERFTGPDKQSRIDYLRAPVNQRSVQSARFYVAGYPCHIRATHWKSEDRVEWLELVLVISTEKEFLCHYTDCSIELISQVSRTLHVKKTGFKQCVSGWADASFITMMDLRDPNKGYITKDGMMTISVEIDTKKA